MALLFDEDYDYLNEAQLSFEEDEIQRLLVLKNYPLPKGMYVSNGTPIQEAEVLVVIPNNYNTEGIDMIWTYPYLLRADGKAIPATSPVGGGDPRHLNGKEYCRWSRHWNTESWKSKEDNIVKILSRIEWALQNPDAKQP